jgi:hypothetical protein
MDIDKIEKVQRRFTKAIFPRLSYNERLDKLNLKSLETRRILTDLITCYKILNGHLDIVCQDFLKFSSVSQTRGNCKKLMKNHIANNREANLFHNRVINYWNKLPDTVVTAPSAYSFKQRLTNFISSRDRSDLVLFLKHQ